MRPGASPVGFPPLPTYCTPASCSTEGHCVKAGVLPAGLRPLWNGLPGGWALEAEQNLPGSVHVGEQSCTQGKAPARSSSVFPIKTPLFPSPGERSAQANRQLEHLEVRTPGLSPPRGRMRGIDTVGTVPRHWKTEKQLNAQCQGRLCGEGPEEPQKWATATFGGYGSPPAKPSLCWACNSVVKWGPALQLLLSPLVHTPGASPARPDPVSVSEGSAVQVASPARRAPPLRSQVPGPTGSRASPQPSAQTANVPRAGALRLSLTNTKVLSSRPEDRPTASPTPFPQEAALSHSAGTSLPRDSPEALWGLKGTSQRF